MTERTFDRRASFDERSRQYPLRALVEEKKLRSYTWRHFQLDQGKEGACVGFACTMEAAARPKPFFGDPFHAPPDVVAVNETARQVYYRAQQIDAWPGENYEGTSVIAGMKVGIERSWWSEYRWALGPGPQAAVRDIALAVGYIGPVVMGTNWWSGMLEADARGFLHPSGEILGGHAWLITSFNHRHRRFWTPNSWGGYGQGWLSWDSMVKLIEDGGEAAVPLVRLMP